MARFLWILVILPVLAASASAGAPQVVNVRIVMGEETRFYFQVTVAHDDTSWEHYLDRWEVIGPNGKILATRVLRHPHIGQPHFMRGLGYVTIPSGVTDVVIRVHDKVHGYGRDKLVSLPTAENPDTGWK